MSFAKTLRKSRTIFRVEIMLRELTTFLMDFLCSLFHSDSKISVLNVFSIHRPVEESAFSHDTGNKRLFFHASKVRTLLSAFLAVLSCYPKQFCYKNKLILAGMEQNMTVWLRALAGRPFVFPGKALHS